MEFRRAEAGDLPAIKRTFSAIMYDMYAKNLEIWDEIYPCEFFAEDVELGRLFALFDGETAVSAFALSRENDGAGAVKWAENGASALYLDRFGVSPDYARRGIGRRMLDEAVRLARTEKVAFLRLFVVDINLPAIKLYEKYGFVWAEGEFVEVIDEGKALREFGYELKL